jgi:hypothetical protein
MNECSLDEIKELASLVRLGCLFEVQKWIDSGKPIPTSLKTRINPLRFSVETGFQSMEPVRRPQSPTVAAIYLRNTLKSSAFLTSMICMVGSLRSDQSIGLNPKRYQLTNSPNFSAQYSNWRSLYIVESHLSELKSG